MLGDAERIGLLQRERWIDYPRASEALGRLLRLLHTPERHRMPCMMLHGPSNFGKTLIIAKFLREHPPVFDELHGIERRLAPRMLVVDEVHHLLAGSYREHRASLNLLKDLANDLRLSIVAVGTDDAPAFSS